MFDFILSSCVILLLPLRVSNFLLTHDAPRNVTKILTTGNGGRWGYWHPPHYCGTGSFAVGFNMKVSKLTDNVWVLTACRYDRSGFI